MKHLFFAAALVALTGCAGDGGFASKAKPIDKAQTLKATCDGIAKLDVAFQAFAKARPGVIDANGMSVEGAALATMAPLCAPPYQADLDAALSAGIAATIQISALLATWR